MKSLKVFHYVLIISFFGFSFSPLSWCSESLDEIEDPYQIGLRGLSCYREGEYIEASKLLSISLNSGQLLFSLTYADICYRNLDDNNHSLKEAAYWYIQAADEANDGDALSYLASLDPIFLGNASSEVKVNALKQIWLMQERLINADKGFTLYTSEQFNEAAKFLKKASQGYHPIAQQLYGDICFRQLDDKPHSLIEASMWYLLSALGGDPQSASYLGSIIPRIWDISDHKSQMRSIVGVWVAEETLSNLKPLNPKQVNDYLVAIYKRPINRTSAQKLPYFFDKVVSAIMCELSTTKLTVSTAIYKKKLPATQENTIDIIIQRPEVSTTSETGYSNYLKDIISKKEFIDERPLGYSFGAVYSDYLEKLIIQLPSHNEFLECPKTLPSINLIYKFILASLQELTSGYKASDLSSLLHRDHPWLLAGIKFWKEKYKKPFNITSMNEGELTKRLTNNEVIEEKDIDLILGEIEKVDDEQKRIWANNKDHPISKEFSDNVRKFFVSQSSIDSRLIQQVKKHFFERIQVQTLDCSSDDDLEILKTPLFMFFCKEIELKNVFSSSSKCSDAISEAVRYFTNLNQLTISFAANFNSKAVYGEKFYKLIKKLQKKWIVIIK